jgi:hypothetical protein
MIRVFIILLLSIFLTLSCSSLKESRKPSSLVSSSKSCPSSIKSLIKKQRQLPEYLEDEVELIWYPKTGYVATSHTDIKIGETVYNAFLGIKLKRDFESTYNWAKSGKGKGFFRFKLAVTPAELHELKRFVKDPIHRRKLQTCIMGACRVLRENSDIDIPFPFSQVPTLNAIYLTVLQKLGNKRVLKVEYVGEIAWRKLIFSEASSELLMTSAASAGSIGLIIWVLSDEDKVEQIIVPITNEYGMAPTSLAQ